MTGRYGAVSGNCYPPASARGVQLADRGQRRGGRRPRRAFVRDAKVLDALHVRLAEAIALSTGAGAGVAAGAGRAGVMSPPPPQPCRVVGRRGS